jgi:hypothetical protein
VNSPLGKSLSLSHSLLFDSGFEANVHRESVVDFFDGEPIVLYVCVHRLEVFSDLVSISLELTLNVRKGIFHLLLLSVYGSGNLSFHIVRFIFGVGRARQDSSRWHLAITI